MFVWIEIKRHTGSPLFQLQSGWCLGASAEIIGQELSCARMGLPWASLLPSFNWASLLNQPPSTSSPILSRFVCGPDTALSFFPTVETPSAQFN